MAANHVTLSTPPSVRERDKLRSMVQHDFKREPEGARLARAWNENRGNWLLATGVIVSLIAWAVGYFRLIPDVTAPRLRTSIPSLMTTGNTLVVKITGCQSDEGQVVGMLYAGESFSEAATALRVELLRIEDRQAVWHIHNLPFGAYAVVAFHDLNSDESLQGGIERQGPVGRNGQGAAGKPLTYADLIFQFKEDQQEVLIQLQ